jgi:poly-gamma-glutamate capsule biosynthesis protein CapA/YwtB (metallophosphatase superfamily)
MIRQISRNRNTRTVTLFLSGDVMTGRGLDQVLPHPSSPCLHERYVDSAREYVALARNANGPIPQPVDFTYIWGDALEELERFAPDIRIINLETTVTTSENYEPKGINYRMHPANTPCLTEAKIDCCVLANNHVLDWGNLGLIETLSTLHHAGLKTVGAGRDLGEALQPAAYKIGPSQVLVFATATEDSGVPWQWAATNQTPGIALLPDLSAEAANSFAAQVRALKRPGDLVVFSIHWGGNWGYEIPPEQKDFAHRLLDLGTADVIYGHSSHHPKAIEVYNERLILYGCGDFLNDYEGVSGYEDYRSNLVLMYFVTLDVKNGALCTLRMVPLQMKRFRLHHAATQDALWLKDVINRQGKRTRTEVICDTDNTLILQWPS